jgi:hypothetical protein
VSDPQPIPIYVGSDTLITLRDLTVASTGLADAAATVTMRLLDSSETVVTGAEALNFSYKSGTDSDYQGTIPSTVTIVEHAKYFLEVSPVHGTNNIKGRHRCVGEYYSGEG